MSRRESDVKRLEKAISDLEARLAAGFDPAFSEMLDRFRALREKYLRLSEDGPRARHSRSKPYWGNAPPDAR